MGDNQQNGHQRHGGGRNPRGAGRGGAGHGRMRMDEIGSNKRKRGDRGEQHEDPYLSLLSSILRLGDRLPVRPPYLAPDSDQHCLSSPPPNCSGRDSLRRKGNQGRGQRDRTRYCLYA